MAMPFTEGGFEFLPEEWQAQCLDLPFLLDALEASCRKGAPLPMPEGACAMMASDGKQRGLDASTAFLAAGVTSSSASSSSSLSSASSSAGISSGARGQSPSLLPSLAFDPRNRRVASLLVAELDHAQAFVVNERRKVAADYAKAESLAHKYLASVKAAGLVPGGGGGAGGPADRSALLVAGGSGASGSGGDPYLRARLKGSLVVLYHERARQVAFRMVTHGLVVRIAERHAELMQAQPEPCAKDKALVSGPKPPPISSPDSGSPGAAEGGGNAQGQVSVGKGLMLLAMSHPFFADSTLPGVVNGQAAEAGTGGKGAGARGEQGGLQTVSLNSPPRGNAASSATASASAAPAAASGVAALPQAPAVVSEEEIARLYAALFCFGDVEVARAALTYHGSLGDGTADGAGASGMSTSGGGGGGMGGGVFSARRSSAGALLGGGALAAFWAWAKGSVGGGGGGGGGSGGGGGFGSGPFGFGLRLGACLVLLVWVLWDCLVDDDMGKEIWHDPAFKVYRGLGNVVLLLLCWGVDLHVWRGAGIDYERFLRLSPGLPGANPCTPVWNVGLDLAIAWLLSFICFWKALRGVFLAGVPPQLAHAFPVSLFVYVAYRAVTPWQARRPLFVAMWEVAVAPFGSTAFKEGFAGDVLTSTVRPLTDLAFSLLYFLAGVRGWASSPDTLTTLEGTLEGSASGGFEGASVGFGGAVDSGLGSSASVGDSANMAVAHAYYFDLMARDTVTTGWLFSRVLVPAITVLPLWWRFCQNLQRSYDTRQRWPHLGNAMKYVTAMMVGLYGLNHKNAKTSVLWICLFVFATLYQYAWDIFMDWDLVRITRLPKKRGANGQRSTLGGVLGSGYVVSLRRPLLYRRASFYAAIALANLGMRFLWTLTLIPEGGAEAWQKTIQVRLSPVLAGAEICRRCVWSFLRLENEHLHVYGTAIDDGFDEHTALSLDPKALDAMPIGSSSSSSSGSSSKSPLPSSSSSAAGADDHAPLATHESDSDDDAKGLRGGMDEMSGHSPQLGSSSGDGAGAAGGGAQHLASAASRDAGFAAHGGGGGAMVLGVFPSSTANLTNLQVVTELGLLAAGVVVVGAFVAFGI